MDNGWIKIHRKFLEWEWYTDTNVKVVFLHLLLTANHEDKSWQGKTIKRGQKITSNESLANELGLSIKQIRTALDKLIKTYVIEKKGTNRYTLITICNYDTYQGVDLLEGQTNGNQKASKGQTNGNKQEYKNERNIYTSPPPACVCEVKPIEDYMLELQTEQKWVEQICMNNKLSLDEFDKKVSDFVTECKCNGKDTANDLKDAKSHFQSWLRIRLQAEKKEKQNANNNNNSTKSNIERIFGI